MLLRREEVQEVHELGLGLGHELGRVLFTLQYQILMSPEHVLSNITEMP